MPTVESTYGAFLHDADDLDDYVTITSRRAPTYGRSPIGDVSITATGRRIWTTSPGLNKTFSVTFRTRDRLVREWIEERDGEVILYRDKRGRRDYAVLSAVDVNDIEGEMYDISMTILPVDHVDVRPIQ